MTLKNIRKIGARWQMLAASMALLSVVAGAALPVASASAAATYSCGTYSSSAYSSNSTCAAANGTVGTPNTGFAKLMEPTNLTAILGSLALIITGVIIALRSRRHKKQNISFDA